MKKYLLGLVAVAAAFGALAFNDPSSSKTAQPKEQALDYYFEFDIANNLPTEENVEDPTKWIEVADPLGCSSGTVRACAIKVPASATNPGSPRTLKNDASIIAEQGTTTGKYRVTQDGSVLQAFNSSN